MGMLCRDACATVSRHALPEISALVELCAACVVYNRHFEILR